MERASVWLHGIEKVYHKDDFDVKISAEEFDLKNDYRFQLVCSSCNSPATFVKHKDGRKYFRHPKRTSKELFESKHSRNIRLANEVIKIKLEETEMSYEEYMSSLKGLDFYYSQKSLDPQFKSLTKLIFMNRHGYYHDAVCNIRYCPPK